MRRRTAALIFTITLTLGTLSAQLTAHAQTPPKIPQIGYLGPYSPSVGAPLLEAFRQGLRELGYVEGQNISIHTAGRRGARIDYQPLPPS